MLPGVMDAVLRRRDEADRDVFDAAGALGFVGVEVDLGRDVRARPAERLSALAAARAATGLQIPSLILSHHVTDGGIADADDEKRRRALEDVRVAIRLAADLSAEVVLVPFFLRSEIDGADSLQRCADAFRALCAEAAAAGVVLLYEGTLAARDVRRLVADVGSPAFGVYFDLANPLVSGLDPGTEIRALQGLIRRVHFKDSRTRRGDCRPGGGRVDYGDCARALAEIGYDAWLVLETPPGPPALVARDLSFARTFFPGLASARDWPRFGAFTYDLDASWERLGERCRELGLETVQLARARLDECLADPALADAASVDVSSIGAYRNLVAPDERERAESLAYVERCLKLAPRVGARAVATHAGTLHPSEEWSDVPANASEAAWTRLLEALERLLPVAESTGAVLALEGSVKSVLRTVARTLELLDRFPSPHLQLVCDPYNYVSRELLPAQKRVAREFLDLFEHAFVVAHVKDVGPEGAEVSTPTVGTGVFPQRPYFDFLRARRPDLPLILEHLEESDLPAAMELVRRT